MENLIDVMAWKYGGKYRYSVGETYDSLVWEDEKIPAPTLEQLKEDSEDYKKHRAKTIYKSQRRNDYPSHEELIISLWEKVIENNSTGADELQIQRQKVKENFPKPTNI